MILVVNGAKAKIYNPELLTSGRVGLMLEMEFDSLWNGLSKAAVFLSDSNEAQTIINVGTSVEIPHESLTTAGDIVKVGVFGYDGDPANIVIPTVYATLGYVHDGADPDVDPSTNPTLPVWGQIQAEIGDLNDLETTDKSNLVAAINEAAQSGGGGGGTSDHTRLTNRDAANQHPMSAITGLVDALAGKQPSGDYATSADLDELANEVDTKQDTISDLATIRSGAALGATAVQPEAGKGLFSGNYNDLTNKPTIPTVPTNVSAFTNDAGYLTHHQSLAEYRKSAAQDLIDADKQPKAITDSEGYFTTDTVEGALAEIGGQLDGLETALDAINDGLEGLM